MSHPFLYCKKKGDVTWRKISAKAEQKNVKSTCSDPSEIQWLLTRENLFIGQKKSRLFLGPF